MVAQQVGQSHEHFGGANRIYADEGQVFLSYSSGDSYHPERWVRIDRNALKWRRPDSWAQPLMEFSPHYGSLELPDGAGMTSIPIYGHRPTVQDAVADYRAQMRRNGASRFPFSAYTVGDDNVVQLLIRDDASDSHEIEVARLAPEKNNLLGPLKRVALYPFAIVIDVATAPFQLWVYWHLQHMSAM